MRKLQEYIKFSNYFLASRIRYEITRGNFGGAFAVKNMTGAIYVAGPLDYETRKRVSDHLNLLRQLCTNLTNQSKRVQVRRGHFGTDTLTFAHLQYELRLVASDNLNENYTKIVIHVNDVNDNPPVFDRPTYETQITEEDDRNLPKRVLKVNKLSQ